MSILARPRRSSAWKGGRLGHCASLTAENLPFRDLCSKSLRHQGDYGVLWVQAVPEVSRCIGNQFGQCWDLTLAFSHTAWLLLMVFVARAWGSPQRGGSGEDPFPLSLRTEQCPCRRNTWSTWLCSRWSLSQTRFVTAQEL